MACEPCLARNWLLGRLAGHIERETMNAPSRRARDLLALDDRELVEAVAPGRADTLRAGAREKASELRATLSTVGVWATCRHDEDYPSRLADLQAAAPHALFGRGERRILASLAEAPGVAIVGARKATTYGREVAHALGRDLALAGLPVISGLAFGVDGASHRGALDGDGLTVAILGGGADVAYPAAHRRLHEEIAATGLLISELPPGQAPFRWCFPARNRIIAALAEITVVVEAAGRSGALITAQMAGELRGTVGAVPGSVLSGLSAGTNALLADGALVVRGAQDLLDYLLGVGVMSVERERQPLEPPLEAALEAIEAGAGTPDEVAQHAGLDAAAASTALVRLELLGLVTAGISGRYSRSAR
jgi:DNA processing protein